MPRTPHTDHVKYVWEQAGVHVWFHYTNIDFAREIDKERRLVVSPRPHQEHGHGVFLTTIRPQELTVEELTRRLFAAQRAHDNVGAVVVLMRDDDLLPVVSAGSRAYVHAAGPGAEIDISPIYLGYGYREDNDDGWMFTKNLHAPNR